MTQAVESERPRILVGLGARRDAQGAVETAVKLAEAIRLELTCLLVEEANLINLAGLPFARAFGAGGLAAELTSADLQLHFERLAKSLTATLTERCARAQISWRILRPQGDVLGELTVTVRPGDIVVLNPEYLPADLDTLLQAARQLLETAAAVVLSPSIEWRIGRVVTIIDDQGAGPARLLAERFATSFGVSTEMIDALSLKGMTDRTSVVVASLSALLAAEGVDLLRAAKKGQVTIVLTPG
jgi:hypothetical protein